AESERSKQKDEPCARVPVKAQEIGYREERKQPGRDEEGYNRPNRPDIFPFPPRRVLGRRCKASIHETCGQRDQYSQADIAHTASGRPDHRTTNLSARGLGVVGVARASPDRSPSDAPPQ